MDSTSRSRTSSNFSTPTRIWSRWNTCTIGEWAHDRLERVAYICKKKCIKEKAQHKISILKYNDIYFFLLVEKKQYFLVSHIKKMRHDEWMDLELIVWFRMISSWDFSYAHPQSSAIMLGRIDDVATPSLSSMMIGRSRYFVGVQHGTNSSLSLLLLTRSFCGMERKFIKMKFRSNSSTKSLHLALSNAAILTL